MAIFWAKADFICHKHYEFINNGDQSSLSRLNKWRILQRKAVWEQIFHWVVNQSIDSHFMIDRASCLLFSQFGEANELITEIFANFVGWIETCGDWATPEKFISLQTVALSHKFVAMRIHFVVYICTMKCYLFMKYLVNYL